MDINFEYHEVNPSESLEFFVTEKLNKLFNKYEFIVRADVFFKIQNSSNNNGKISGVRLSAPGPRLFAEADSDTYHKSVTEALTQLERQLEKRKGKMKTH